MRNDALFDLDYKQAGFGREIVLLAGGRQQHEGALSR